MSYRIDPSGYCVTDGCTRPKAAGERVCSQCSRLARATGSDLGATGILSTGAAPPVPQVFAAERRPPRCIAYLSIAGDVITLELIGEPKFTQADVELLAGVLSNRRKEA